MDRRLTDLADQLAAGLMARREFLRKAAVITGGTAAGLGVLNTMAHAQGPKLPVWLFKSHVTAGNDNLARQVEDRAEGRKGPIEFEQATVGDRGEKFVGAIGARTAPTTAERNHRW